MVQHEDRTEDQIQMSAHNLFAADPLLQAMFQKDIDKVKALLAAGAQLVTEKVPGLSPLQVATRNQQRDAKERQIASIVVAHARTLAVDALPLPLAARVGHVESVRYHIAQSPLNNSNSDDYAMAAIYAVQEGHAEVLLALLDAGIGPDTRSHGLFDLPMNGQPLLSIAAAMGQVKVAKLLIERKADINLVYSAPHESDITPLMEAVRFNRLPLVKLLVESGCNVGLKDGSGKYALTYARRDGYKRITSYLETSSASLPLFQKMTLHEAAREGALSRVDELIKTTENIDAVNVSGETPLMLAARFGNWEVVEHLCVAGANPNLESGGESSIWLCALLSDDLKTVQCLLKHGLNPNLKLSNGMPPLVKAAEASRVEIVQALLEAGADPRAIYKAESVPQLRIAARNLMQQVRRDAGGRSFNRAASQGYDALESAKRAGNKKVYSFLKTLMGVESDAYDEAISRSKTLPSLADELFHQESKRLAKILQAEGKPWSKRKGVIHFVSPLAKALRAYYPPPSNVRELFSKETASDEMAMFRKLQGEVIDKGYCLIYTELDYQGKSLARLLLLPVDDPLLALVACGTNADNYGMGTREVVNWCAETLRKNPYNILGAGFDFMDLDFNLPIIDLASLIERIVEFCPAIDNHNEEELVLFGKKLDKFGRCFFWWD